jgi:cyclophilin family peptidyl-prolyl cis-trans isomerase
MAAMELVVSRSTDLLLKVNALNNNISVYHFSDENFVVSHDYRGILGMANRGPHTNGSQFFITLKPMPCFNHLYVAFARIVDGEKVLRALEAVPVEYPEKPAVLCAITAIKQLSNS